jgi:hypothetical protein
MAISDRISAMYDHVGDIYDTLELGGDSTQNKNIVNINSEIKREYKDFLANGTDTLWNNWNKVSGTGESLTLNNTIKGKMKIDLKGNTSQEGTPNPDYPQEIHTVSGDNTLVVSGKNLFKINNYQKNGWNIRIANPLKGMSAGNYTISCENTHTTDTAIIFSNDGSTQIGGYFVGYNFGKTIQEKTTTLTQEQLEANYLVFTPQANTYSQEILESMQIMIEKGSTATTYEPYVSQEAEVNLGDIELCKIGDYQDSIVKDNCKWYLNKQIGKVVLDGSESWNRELPENNIINYYIKINEAINNNNIPIYNNMALYNRTISGKDNNHKCYISSSNNLNFRADEIATTSDLKTLLASTNMFVYYALATPTYEEITDSTLISQLEAIKYSYNNQTNISQENNDKPFILDVTALGELEI